MNEFILLAILVVYMMIVIIISVVVGIQVEERFNFDALPVSFITVGILISTTLLICGLLI